MGQTLGFVGVGRMGGPMALNLVKAGFEVAVASSGELARQKLHSFNPHAVVLDLMVDEDAGDAVIKELRRDPGAAKLPIYAFASSPSSRAARKAMKAAIPTSTIFAIIPASRPCSPPPSSASGSRKP